MPGQETNGNDRKQDLAEPSSDESVGTQQQEQAQQTLEMPPETGNLIQAMLGSDAIQSLALFQKLTPEHVTQMLNMRKEEVQLIAKDRESIRRHVLIILGIAISSAVLFLSLLVWFDLKEHIGPFAVAISSAIGGIGLGMNWRR
jgi:membrane glycosyltransferase